ncbi:DNA polymerase I [Roseiarcus fermentans]|uniref:DNA polymerase I n=1 Tax=Roseiarcus fermentans TaxID=1473586 RepID=A0A366FWK6_9HYPH|nr:DNA polymerase I [Roseiarcus fermentans]RBP18410.1 DNA polymerase I [Roseiarcus fermentans]
MTQPHRPLGPGDHVFLVDGSSFVFRAYYQSIRQDQKYNYRTDRLPIGAVRLFATKMLQFVKDGAAGIKPTHLAIIFDKSENSFRKDIYPEYKGNRKEPPEDLVPQFPLMRATVRAFGMVPVEQDVYEADDLIATYARQAREQGADVLIVSADKDLMQLIGPGVAMYDPASGDRDERRIGEAEVVDYFGVGPDKVVDVQALAGDSTDNVPGAPGIGVKTAAQLIVEYGDLETLLACASQIKQPKRREALTAAENVERIRISKQLVALVRDVPVETPLEALATPTLDGRELVAFFKAMELSTITRRVAEMCGVDAAAIEPDPRFVGPAGWQGREGEALLAREQEAAAARGPAPAAPSGAATPAATPADLARARAAEARAPVDRSGYARLETLDQIAAVVALAHETGVVAFDVQASSPDPMKAELIGLALSVAPGQACYLPFGHRAGPDDLFGSGAPAAGQLAEAGALALLKPLLEARGVVKVGHDAKFAIQVLAGRGVTVAPIDDTMLVSYALDGGSTGDSHDLADLSKRILGHAPIALADVAGAGRNAVGIARADLGKAAEYAAEKVDVILRLWRAQKPRLAAERVTTVYETLERPLVAVLARMERRGVAIDRDMLSRLAGDFSQTMARLEDDIAGVVGQPFNPGSPKQLGDILFGQMGLPGGKKTATGAWSTTASVLEDLAAEGHALPAKVLEWRQVAKLKSTYADALPGYVDAAWRVHTSYALAATTTGRLSSSEPNLQNIPVRTELGRKIRRAFVAPKGRKLISADYSQIELRLLAHIADIPALKKAFAEGLDIHAMTASEMFGVPVAGMAPEIRRRAKAINFGIIYGISAFGLANQLGIAREEAGAYIRKYFERFPGIRDYMEATKKAARADGYVTTIFGRKCHYPRIGSSNASERAFNERAAINAPIQGSAADIIRRAMVRMEAALTKADLSAQMLLQVHDELVFEAPDDEVEATLPVVTRVMIDAPEPALKLHVPLQVDARAAQNWEEAH